MTTTTTTITTLTAQLTASLRRPTRQTLSLIDKALSYLTPFESAQARTTSAAERSELLSLLNAHRMLLAPYLDTDLIARNLSHARLKC